jgi:hypothetical protein
VVQRFEKVELEVVGFTAPSEPVADASIPKAPVSSTEPVHPATNTVQVSQDPVDIDTPTLTKPIILRFKRPQPTLGPSELSQQSTPAPLYPSLPASFQPYPGVIRPATHQYPAVGEVPLLSQTGQDHREDFAATATSEGYLTASSREGVVGDVKEKSDMGGRSIEK